MREANDEWAGFVARLISSRYGGRQSGLAEEIGVSPSTVTRWLDGATPAIPQLRAISDNLGFAMAELLTAAGALDSAADPEPSAAPAILADVAEAIRQDANLLEEAKQHLLNQYGLLLRLAPAQATKSDRRAKSPSGDTSQLRAVARGGDPKDRSEVRRIARAARQSHDRNTGKDK